MAQVTVDVVGTAVAIATNASRTISVAAGTPSAAVICVAFHTVTVSSVTYGGNTCTLAVNYSDSSSGTQVSIYTTTATPPSGTQNAVVTFSGTGGYGMVSAFTVNNSAASPVNAVAFVRGLVGTPTATANSAVNELMVSCATITAGGQSPSGGATERADVTDSFGVNGCASTLAASSGSTAMSWTNSGNVSWGIVVASLLEGGGGSSSLPILMHHYRQRRN